jgi:SAM-dependent methyltransferase
VPAEEYGPATYGDRIADVYDEWFSVPTDADEAADFLAELAGGGPALELGIGTGRIALPLARRGVSVHGIDASESMVAKLRQKPGGEAIPVTIGDFADVQVEGAFRLIFVAFNTIFALLTQEDQLRCFANVAAHLSDDGVFAVQAFVPDLTLFNRGSRVSAQHVGLDAAAFDLAELDMATQQVTAQHIVLRNGSVTLYPVTLRFAYAPELDLMGRLAGLRLRERWAGWKREQFGSSSGQHVSVWQKDSKRR